MLGPGSPQGGSPSLSVLANRLVISSVVPWDPVKVHEFGADVGEGMQAPLGALVAEACGSASPKLAATTFFWIARQEAEGSDCLL